ncbi:hypothetical protein EZS27_037440 [termite gut metagenome]|uniref:Uncharacterized protein n=1 Tax=termite gut metagenome TaxID=433724 RepID=A0A5J4PPI5_9ZZZZ
MKITKEEITKIEELEEKSIIANAQNDKRKKDSIIFESKRVGINANNHKEYSLFKLRSLIELKEPKHPFKEKEKVVISYFEDHIKEITPDNIKEITPDNIKELLGCDSKYIRDYFKSKNLIMEITFYSN